MVTTVQRMQVFTSALNLFTAPAGVTGVWVTMIGGGGGGGSAYQTAGGVASPGGSSGELVVRWPVKVTPLASYLVTVAQGNNGNIDYTQNVGTPGGDTDFGGMFFARGGQVGIGGGAGGGTGILAQGVEETPVHRGGSNRSAGGHILPTGLSGTTGATGPGYPGGLPGPPTSGYTGYIGGGGGGGASTAFGQGGRGGNGGGVGGSSHGSTGNTGGNPPSTNGNGPVFDPINFPYKWPWGAGGGGAGGSPGGYSGKPVWGGNGAAGICMVEWYEEVP